MDAAKKRDHLRRGGVFAEEAVSENPRWTALLIECAGLRIGDAFVLVLSSELINKFRAILRVSGRTSRWRWTVRKTEEPDTWFVTKVGLW